MKINTYLKSMIFTMLCVIAINVQPAKAQQNAEEETVYHEASYANFAKTYWRFRKFETKDTAMIDSFMKINECDLFTEYAHNEFEWDGIREATREHLENNKKKFPANYQFVQPISLDEYDFGRKGFNIAEEFAMLGVKRFEIVSDKFRQEVCGKIGDVSGYPKVIALELTRPLVFDFFNVEPKIAEEIISQKMESYELLPKAYKSRTERLKAREVYMVAKVKMFAYKPDDMMSQQGYTIAPMLGILEEIEIYADRKLTKLMHRKDLRRKKRVKQKEF